MKKERAIQPVVERGTAQTFEERVMALHDRAEADLAAPKLGTVLEGAVRLVGLDVDADEPIRPATVQLWEAKAAARQAAAA